ncbi:hypothetical protein [Thermoactinomyces mirandus]|nr:hypothetical protein [Thermoactinomyces mirandus]
MIRSFFPFQARSFDLRAAFQRAKYPFVLDQYVNHHRVCLSKP